VKRRDYSLAISEAKLTNIVIKKKGKSYISSLYGPVPVVHSNCIV
jgi:hypothetical protein